MSLEVLFSELPKLPNIPKVIQQLIEEFNRGESSATDITKNIKMDQVLSAKILRLANSARYGAGRKISSIDSAVVMLGNDVLKTLVIASGIVGAFKDLDDFDKKTFWRDSFMIASMCKLIAKHTHCDPETAFTCGIMHNIGELLMHIADPVGTQKIDKLVEAGASRCELENNQFGFDYTEAGAELAKRWNFPKEIVSAIRQQASTKEFESHSAYATIIYLASYLNNAFKTNTPPEKVLSEFPTEITRKLSINLVSFFESVIELTKAEDDIEAILA
jgi:HD-like signal output (HDOD) protein